MSQNSSENESSQPDMAGQGGGEGEGGSGSDGGRSASPPLSTCQGARPLLASAKRPLMTHSKDGKLLSEKKLRRLEKNRLSARECRRRKREATENLERQIVALEGENLRLRLQLQIGEEAEDKMQKEQEKVTEGIVELLESGASDAEIYDNIETFKEKFADYGRDRRSAIEFHLRNIERLLMPTQTTTVVCRALEGGVQAQPPAAAASNDNADTERNQQAPSSDQTVAAGSATTAAATKASASAIPVDGPPPTEDPKALFQYLVKHLEVTPEQGAALKDSRFVAKELDSQLEKAFKMLDELKERLTQCGDDLEAEFNNVRTILTPTQSAKFLVWVANNGACMHMLNELWSRVYPHSFSDGFTLEESPSTDAGSP